MSRSFALFVVLVPALASAQTVYVAPTPEVSVTVPAPAPPAPPVYAPPAPPMYAPPPPPMYVPPPPRAYVPPVRVYVPPPPRVYVAPPMIGVVPPHVYIRERVRWHVRRAAAALLAAVPPPPTVYVAPGPPVPPPLVAPPPCCCNACAMAPPPPPTVYVAPAPPPPPAPMVQEVVVVRPAPPPVGWKSRFGLGVRGTGQVVNDNWNNLGIGGELLYRASNHVSLELAAEYQKNLDGNLDRVDVPVTTGVRIHIGNPHWIVSPYFVLAAGFDFANLDLKVTNDTAFFFDAQLGGGLELRLGQHFAITADARFDGKKRIDDPSPAVQSTRLVDGKPVSPLGDQYGGQFRLGAAVYF
jgi:hypothetical protein